MKKILFVLALLGWIASVVVHISAISGNDLSKEYPFIMVLHVGIFVVWFPMMLELRKDEDYKKFKQSGALRRSNPFAVFRILLKNAPTYLRVIVIAGFIYAPVNFFLSIPDFVNEVNSSRHFSGHWIAFYGAALGALYPFKQPVVL